MKLVDSHCHVKITIEKGLTINDLARKASDAGLAKMMDIGVELEDTRTRLELIEKIPGAGYSLGLYPSHADNPDRAQLIENLEAMIIAHSANHRFWALGEMGLDYHWNFASPQLQKELFKAQLELSVQHSFPVVIHNRDADEDVLALIKQTGANGIMHCFSSDSSAMFKALDLGMYISFAGNLSYPNSRQIQEAALQVPLDRVLFETDSPYLTPVPLRGKLNHPGNVLHVYEYFAKLRGLGLDELASMVFENFTRAVPRSAAIED